MAYDIRDDAFGALTLGGVGALGGLGWSLFNKKQRKNKLINALIGAAALPSLYVGRKYLSSKLIPKDEHYALHASDPIARYISSPLYYLIYDSLPNPEAITAIEAREKRDRASKTYWDMHNKRVYSWAPGRENVPQEEVEAENTMKQLESEYNQADANYEATKNRNYNKATNISAVLGYGTLGAGIGLPALYLAHLNRKKKKRKGQLA